MVQETYIPQGVNPHQGIEWQLMQKGQKQLALFALHHESLPDEFQSNHPFQQMLIECDAHESSRKQKNKKPNNKRRRGVKKLTFHIFFLANSHAQKQAQKLADLLQECYQADGRITPEIEKEIGQLLGYTDKDIETYLAWVEQFQNSLYLPETMPKMPT